MGELPGSDPGSTRDRPLRISRSATDFARIGGDRRIEIAAALSRRLTPGSKAARCPLPTEVRRRTSRRSADGKCNARQSNRALPKSQNNSFAKLDFSAFARSRFEPGQRMTVPETNGSISRVFPPWNVPCGIPLRCRFRRRLVRGGRGVWIGCSARAGSCGRLPGFFQSHFAPEIGTRKRLILPGAARAGGAAVCFPVSIWRAASYSGDGAASPLAP